MHPDVKMTTSIASSLLDLLPNDVIREIVARISDVATLLAFRECCREAAYVFAPFVPKASMDLRSQCTATSVIDRERPYTRLDPNADANRVAALEWMKDRFPPVVLYEHPTRTMDRAAEYGHLEVVKWLHANRVLRDEGCTYRAMDGAAINGHLDVVKWLHANRTEGCTKYAMDLHQRK